MSFGRFRVGMRWLALGVTLLLLTPVAAAQSVAGEFLVRGTLRLPDPAIVMSDPSAIYVPDVTRLERFEGSVAHATIQVIEQRYVTANIAGQQPAFATGSDRPSWEVQNATLRIEGTQPGWLGIHARGGTARETSKSGSALASELAPEVGVSAVQPDEGDPETPYFLARPGLSIVREADVWTYAGSGILKTAGSRVHVETARNSTTLQTGEFADPQNPAQTIRRWITIQFQGGDLLAIAPTELASVDAEVSWTGVARLESTSGRLSAGLSAWEADGGDESIGGRFEATLDPTVEESTRMRVSGELETTSMPSHTQIVTPTGGTAAWLTLFLLATAAIAGGALLARRRRRLPGREPDPTIGADEYAQLADAAADAGDYASAARWAAFARELSPTSSRLALDLAFFTFKNGDTPSARNLLKDKLLRDDPDAHFLLMQVHMADGREKDAAMALATALRLAPVLVLDIEDDPALARLLARPDVRRAVRAAHSRIE